MNDNSSNPIFHIGCVTLVLAAVLGYPIGAAIGQSLWGHNAGPLAGSFGFLFAMFFIGFFNRRRQRDGRALPAMPALKSKAAWAGAIPLGLVGALFGAILTDEIGGSELGYALGFGFVGMIVGGAAGYALSRRKCSQD